MVFWSESSTKELTLIDIVLIIRLVECLFNEIFKNFLNNRTKNYNDVYIVNIGKKYFLSANNQRINHIYGNKYLEIK